MSAIAIRPEKDGDQVAIGRLAAIAFDGVPNTDDSVAEITDALRRDGDLFLSLVAEDEQTVVGHLPFSPVTITDGSENWFGLGPISVDPAMQNQGIGFRLIQRGIADMRAMKANGIVVLGDPDYYRRFGFEYDPLLTFDGYPPEWLQGLVLNGKPACGAVIYSDAFR